MNNTEPNLISNYNPNMFIVECKMDSVVVARIKDIQKGQAEFDVPSAHMKPLMRFIKSTKQPFTLSQLHSYYGSIHNELWFQGLLDEAVKFSIIEYEKDGQYYRANVITSIDSNVSIYLDHKLDLIEVKDIIQKASTKANEILEEIIAKLKDTLPLIPINEKLEFLKDCRDSFWQYYTDRSNPLYQYDVTNLEQLAVVLSSSYHIVIPDTFFTNNPQKYISDILFNAITNKLALKLVIGFYTQLIDNFSTHEKKTFGTIEERTDNEQQAKTRISTLSYKWLFSVNKLQELYSILVHKGYIIDSEIESFEAAFTEKLLGTFEPIKWHDDNATELLFFIRALIKLKFIEDPSFTYIRLVGCFSKPNGDEFKSNFKSINQSLDIDLGTDKQRAINDMLAKLSNNNPPFA